MERFDSIGVEVATAFETTLGVESTDDVVIDTDEALEVPEGNDCVRSIDVEERVSPEVVAKDVELGGNRSGEVD